MLVDNDNALFERSAAANNGHLAGLLVDALTVFCLHGATSLLFDHCGCLIVAVGQRRAFEFGCWPRFVVGHQVSADVELLFAYMGKVLCCAPVVRFTTADVAG